MKIFAQKNQLLVHWLRRALKKNLDKIEHREASYYFYHDTQSPLHNWKLFRHELHQESCTPIWFFAHAVGRMNQAFFVFNQPHFICFLPLSICINRQSYITDSFYNSAWRVAYIEYCCQHLWWRLTAIEFLQLW